MSPRTRRLRGALLLASAACAGLLAAAAPSGPAAAPADEGDEALEHPYYLGAEACKKCHKDQHESWAETRMANAFDLLRPGVRVEEKEKAGLDPQKDYTRDETCLPCHTTGYGEPGGYAIPPEGDSPEAKKAQQLALERQGVQCEACHGPASKAAEFKSDNERYKWADLEAASGGSGIRFPTEEICRKCHNTDSPFVGDDYVFDFATRKDEGTHVHSRMDFEHDCPHEHTPTKRSRKKRKSD